ncbi:hypothetical protein BU17DRAFT_39482 [Hysterangium stoloniferum]|nr:hypothetical protein BU17DRAFT_39482 [Hysterangium stoloniferum]
MQTPPRKQGEINAFLTRAERNYTEEEKRQLLANLDLEVKDRIRQFEAYLAHSLEAFKLRHENEVTRIPRAIRTLTVGEFADKYDGDVNKALQALTKAKMEASGEPVGLEASIRKRKWQASADDPQEVAESSRAVKNARVASPHKKQEAAGARPRLVKTPAARLRRPPPSPAILDPRSSPHKAPNMEFSGKLQQNRISSNTGFNPALPKTPAFPRRLRVDDSLLSANGSPPPNPYEFDQKVFPLRQEHSDTSQQTLIQRKLERQRSIAVLRGPSLTQPSGGAQGSQPPSVEVILSIKVPTIAGGLLEFDPLSTTVTELELLKGITEEARNRAKDELQELNSLMAKLGKWRI